jgi:glycosyltransferase involved in cell wall biosynthesis
VLPAFVEHKPRRLLQAVAAGVPVIASDACGVSSVSGITTVVSGDAVALRDGLCECLNKKLGKQKQLIHNLVSHSIGGEANL